MIAPRARLASLRRMLVGPPSDQAEIREFQDRQLRRLVVHAGRNVPYYRALFRGAGFDPERFLGLAELNRIPLSTKRGLQVAGEDCLTSGWNSRRLFVRRTSGSTAEPISVRCSWFEESLLSCLRARLFHRTGIGVLTRARSVKLIMHSRRAPRWIRLFQRWGLFRRDPIDCLQPPDRILAQLKEADPEVVFGFPGVLSLVAQQARPGDFRSLRAVLVGGETLTPLMRGRIEQGFEVPVLDAYASHEFNQIALQCPGTGLYHVCDDRVILEVLVDGRPAREGETGEVVATGLHSFVMPFIRYRLGDLAVRGPGWCPCGAPYSTLQRIEGRITDALLLPGDRVIHPFELMVPLSADFEWIAQFQILQEDLRRVTLFLDPLTRPAPGRLESLQARLQSVLGPDVLFNIIMVDAIPPAPSGKRPVCRSLVWNQQTAVSAS